MHGFAIRLARDVGEPAHRLKDARKARLVAIGTILPETRRAQDDQSRLYFPQDFLCQSPTV